MHISTASRSVGLPAGTELRHPDDRFAGYLHVPDHRAFLADPDQVARLADGIAETAIAAQAEIVSWDVFDTALLREPMSEARRFHVMGAAFSERMTATGRAPSFTAEDALLARAEAARASYRMALPRHGNREGTLGEIARIACSLLRCDGRADDYVRSELEAEAARLQPNPVITAVAERLPSVRTIFVSDMYLEGRHILDLVCAKFPQLEIFELFSSADGKGSKRSGGIFASVEASLGVPGQRFLHLGDSLHSDFRMPRKHGWNSLYLPLPEVEHAARRACYDALCDELAACGVDLAKYLHFNI